MIEDFHFGTSHVAFLLAKELRNLGDKNYIRIFSDLFSSSNEMFKSLENIRDRSKHIHFSKLILEEFKEKIHNQYDCPFNIRSLALNHLHANHSRYSFDNYVNNKVNKDNFLFIFRDKSQYVAAHKLFAMSGIGDSKTEAIDALFKKIINHVEYNRNKKNQVKIKPPSEESLKEWQKRSDKFKKKEGEDIVSS